MRLKTSTTKFITIAGYEFDSYFEDEIFYIFDFKSGNIVRMEQFRDTFKILQRMGRAAMKSNDPKVIQNYINKLNEFDILVYEE